jgi:hypothetical protein
MSYPKKSERVTPPTGVIVREDYLQPAFPNPPPPPKKKPKEQPKAEPEKEKCKPKSQ